MATSINSATECNNMNKSAALERLTKLESEAAELRKIIEQPEEVGLWEPKHGGGYWRVSSDGVSDVFCNESDSEDISLIEHGNVFPTESIARKASALQRKFNFYLQACFQADPDAGEWSKERQYAVFLDGIKWRCCFSKRHSIPCVHTEVQAIEACRLLNAWQAKEDSK